MLQAFIDDSGKGSSPVYVLAGFAATVNDWAAFSDEWQTILALHPKIEYFKANEAAACRGQFNGWSKERRNERVNQLIAVIRERARFAVYSVVPHDTFKEVFKGKIAKGMDNPYFLTFFGVMQAMMKYQHLSGAREKVDFIFDEELITKQVRDAWDLFVRFAPPEAASLIGSRPIERNDKAVLPLQAADLLAWKVRRYFYDKYEEKREPLWPWDDLSGIKTITEGWDKERLQKMYERMLRFKDEHGVRHPYDK